MFACTRSAGRRDAYLGVRVRFQHYACVLDGELLVGLFATKPDGVEVLHTMAFPVLERGPLWGWA